MVCQPAVVRKFEIHVRSVYIDVALSQAAVRYTAVYSCRRLQVYSGIQYTASTPSLWTLAGGEAEKAA